MSKNEAPSDIALLVTKPSLPTLADLAAMSTEEQMVAITNARQLSTAAQAYIGKALANLKATIKHGEYEPLLKANGWNKKTAQRYVQFADFADEVSAINPSALRYLDMTRWMVVRRELDKETFVRFVSGEEVCGITLTDAEEKGSRELKLAFEEHSRSANSEISRQQKVILDLEAQLESSTLEKEAIKSQLMQSTLFHQFADFVMSSRHESGAMADKAMLCIDDLARMDSDLFEAAQVANGDDVNIALTSLYTHVNALFAHTQNLRTQMHSRWGSLAENTGVTGEVLYSDQEIDAAISSRALLVRDHEQQKRFRTNEREDAKPRGRGRPKKQ